MVFDELAGALMGLQETVVFEAFDVTVRENVPLARSSHGSGR